MNNFKKDIIQKKILEIEEPIKVEVCSDLPNAFWNRNNKW